MSKANKKDEDSGLVITEQAPLEDMLNEVDAAMKKSKLFTMTQLTASETN